MNEKQNNPLHYLYQMKNHFQKNARRYVILISFLLPTLTIAAVYARLDFYPFGNKSVLIMDMSDQYAEFFASLRYALKGEGSLLFSWSRSMGGNFLGIFAYYLASPLSFLTLFFSIENLPIALFLLMIIKTGLCGMTFAIYLEYGWNQNRRRLLTLVFACCYALMSYAVVYGMCLMWLDGLIFLPLILLGIEKLLQGKKGLLFLVSLTGIFICNYYTAYMVGIFAAMYIVYRAFCLFSKEHRKQVLSVFFRFAGNTVLAFGISAPLILPVAKDLTLGKLGMKWYVPDQTYWFELWYLVRKFFGGTYDSITNTGTPSIFCGTFIVVLVVLFFFMRKIGWKEKVGTALIFGIFIASFWIVELDKVWHGFQYPNWFPFRYAFLFSSFMLITAYHTAMRFEFSQKTRRKLAGPAAVYVVCILLVFQYAELYYNAETNITGLDAQFKYKKMSDYQSFMNRYQKLVDEVKKDDNGFYRMEKDAEFSKNDAMVLGYHGMTHYSSAFHVGVNEITKGLGLAQYYIWNSGYGSTILTDSIFNVKYRMMKGTLPDTYQKLKEEDGVSVYKNTKVLPIAFASGKVDTIEFSMNNFANQNQLFNKLAQTEDVKYFQSLEYEQQPSTGWGWKYLLTAEDSNPLYLRIYGNNGSAKIYADSKYMGSHFSNETNCNLYVGQYEKGEKVDISCETTNVTKSSEFLYKMDLEAFNKAYQHLAEGGLQVTRHKGSTIEGTIKTGSDQMIFTSIPYDEGFTVKIDGEEVKTSALKIKKDGEVLDTFLIVPQIGEGEHQFCISYMPPGFLVGICLSVLSVLAAVAYYRGQWLLERFRNKVQK